VGRGVEQQGEICIGHGVSPRCRARKCATDEESPPPLKGPSEKAAVPSAPHRGAELHKSQRDAETSRLADGPQGGRPASNGRHLPRGMEERIDLCASR
jgi:hypothetical protein